MQSWLKRDLDSAHRNRSRMLRARQGCPFLSAGRQTQGGERSSSNPEDTKKQSRLLERVILLSTVRKWRDPFWGRGLGQNTRSASRNSQSAYLSTAMRPERRD